VRSPYDNLEDEKFWKHGVVLSDPQNIKQIHVPKWGISASDVVVTMGSCFAQHIATWLRERDLNVPFFDDTENIKSPNFSANYGNVYTVRQARQLAEEVAGQRAAPDISWKTPDGLFVDPLRPNVFAKPFETAQEISQSRQSHLAAVGAAFRELDILVFTLGLTETWFHRQSGAVLPVAPGVLAGDFDPQDYGFANFNTAENLEDLRAFCDVVTALRGGRDFRLILTVSPVPLTATYEDRHVLQSTTYSKAVLRSVAGDFVRENAFADYFPSYEIINNPAAKSGFFEGNLRSVKPSAVEVVMGHFMTSYFPGDIVPAKETDAAQGSPSGTKEKPAQTPPVMKTFDENCEEALLEGFADARDVNAHPSYYPDDMVVVVGNSHLVASSQKMMEYPQSDNFAFAPTRFLANDPFKEIRVHKLRTFLFKEEHWNFRDFFVQNPKDLVIVGLGFFGDNIINNYGGMKPGFEGAAGHQITPTLPKVEAVTPELVQFYLRGLAKLVQNVFNIEQIISYQRIFWIVAPDMPEQTARFRLGDDFVDGGYFNIHKQAYLTAFNLANKGLAKTTFIMQPWDELCAPSGFTMDALAQSDDLSDIHCSKDYYKSAIDRLMALLES
jgi:hypothetical protein